VREARSHFSRLQVLHLWEWVEADLIELGIKHIDPSIFATADLRRCSTAQVSAVDRLLMAVDCPVECDKRSPDTSDWLRSTY
jgi:hypothetical protein